VRLLPALASLALVLSACGSGADAFAIVASSPGTIGVGEQRVLVAVIDRETQQFLVEDEVEATATLRDENGSPLGTAPAELVWTIPDVRGLLSFTLDFPEPATYQLTVETEEWGELGPVGLVSVADPAVVSPGDAAPPSETRTSDSHPIDEITSDPDPDPRFYEMSVAEAVSRGPSVVVFATPAWCSSQACGPLLDQVGELSADYQGLNFVHVEIYEDISVESIEELEAVPAVTEWGLPSEPWVFVTDATGTVTHAFEGAASDTELRAAFDQVSG
jgi:hypothetical protein